MKRTLCASMFLACSATLAVASSHLSEFSSDPDTVQWVELVNHDTSALIMNGWQILTSASACTLNCTLQAGHYLIVDPPSLAAGHIGHGNFVLNPAGDHIVLVGMGEKVLYPATPTDRWHSFTPPPHGCAAFYGYNTPDSSGNWYIDSVATPGRPNDQGSCITGHLVGAPDTVVTLSLTGIGGTFKVPVDPGDSFIIAGLNPGAYALGARATWRGKVYVDTSPGPLALGYGKTLSGITVGMVRSRWSKRHSILFGTTSVRDGDALAGASVSGKSYVYALKGSGSYEFYRYDPAEDEWSPMAGVPLGVSGYPASTGAALTSVGGRLYATKGTQSSEFYSYDPAVDRWAAQQDVLQNYQAGAGGCLTGVQRGDSSFVCFLQSGSNHFSEFSVSGDSWEDFPMVPPGPMSNRFEYGSCMTSDGVLIPYVLVGLAYDEFWSYDFADDYWRSLAKLPLASRSGTEIRAYKGASLAFAQGAIYALKGAGTSEFWRYNPVTDSWQQLDDIPVGSFGISEGGAMAYCPGDSALYVLQGGRTLSFYRYDLSGLYYPAAASARVPSPGTRQANPIVPNTPRLSRDLATISYTTMASCRVNLSLYDVAGKLRRRTPQMEVSAGKHEASVSTQGLPRGIYIMRLVAGTSISTAKVVLE